MVRPQMACSGPGYRWIEAKGTGTRGVMSGPPFPYGTSFTLNLLTTSGLDSVALPASSDAVTNVAITPMPISLTADDSAYPFDSYAAQAESMYVSVSIPGYDETDVAVNAGPVSAALSIPTNVAAIPGEALSFPNQEFCESGFTLVFRRPIGIAQVWLIMMALLPIAFAPFILIASKAKGMAEPVAIAGTALGLVAILPLHSVLVPPNVPSPTVIDYLLGADMTVILLAFVIGRLWSDRSSKTVNPNISKDQDQ